VLVAVAVGELVAVGVSVLTGGGGRVRVGEGTSVGSVTVVWAVIWAVLVGWRRPMFSGAVSPGVAQP
jgi:hypothetical protein